MKCPLCSAPHRERWAEVPGGIFYWECTTCALVWLDESLHLKPEEESARYSQHENATDNATYLTYLWRTAGPVVEKLPPGAIGLDFGCGPTEGMKALLSPRGYVVKSYDPLFHSEKTLLNFRYDFVLCSEAAEHFFRPAQEFSCINSLLREGGLFGVSSQLCVSQEEFPSWYYRKDPTHVVFYREKTVHWLAQQFGWKVLKLESPLWVFQKLSGGGRNLA